MCGLETLPVMGRIWQTQIRWLLIMDGCKDLICEKSQECSLCAVLKTWTESKNEEDQSAQGQESGFLRCHYLKSNQSNPSWPEQNCKNFLPTAQRWLSKIGELKALHYNFFIIKHHVQVLYFRITEWVWIFCRVVFLTHMVS